MKAAGETISKKERGYKDGQMEIITKENGAMASSKVKAYLSSQMAVPTKDNFKAIRSTGSGSITGTNPAHMKAIGNTTACKAEV